MIDGDELLKSIRAAKRRKLEREHDWAPTNAFDALGYDENAAESSITRERFFKERRGRHLRSGLTKSGKESITSRVESTRCPFCGHLTMRIRGYDGDTGTIWVTCTNKWCTNNADGPFRFNATEYAFERGIVPRRVGEPLRMW